MILGVEGKISESNENIPNDYLILKVKDIILNAGFSSQNDFTYGELGNALLTIIIFLE